MSFAPNHEFHQFEAATARTRRSLERRASHAHKAERFAELVAISRNTQKLDLSLVDRQKRWEAEKLPIRLLQVTAFYSVE